MKTYFILDECRGMLKIGKSTDPASRMQNLQTASGSELKLIGVLEDDRESELHARFAAARSVGEWFFITDFLSEALKADFGFKVETRAHRLLPAAPSWRVELAAAVDAKIGCTPEAPDADKLEAGLYDPLMELAHEQVYGKDEGAEDQHIEPAVLDQFVDEAMWEALNVQEHIIKVVTRYKAFWLGWLIDDKLDGYFNIFLVFQRPSGTAFEGLIRALGDAAWATESDWVENIRVWPLLVSQSRGLEDMLGEVY